MTAIVPLLPADKAETAQPGRWWAGADRRWVSVTCGGCGKGVSLVRPSAPSHVVDAQGNVTPSVVCPYDGCGWHVHVRLEGWTP